MNELPRQKLCEIIAKYGRSLCEDPRRCEALLRDFCGQYRGEISVLVNSLKEGVAADLLASQKSVLLEVLIARLTQRLQNNLYLSEEAARWAVESWALALGVIANPQGKIPKPQTEDFFTTSPSNSIPSINLQSPEPPDIQPQTPQETPVHPTLPASVSHTTQSPASNSPALTKVLPWAVVIGLAVTGLASLTLLNRIPSPQPISSPTPSAEPPVAPSPNSVQKIEPERPSPTQFVRDYYSGVNNRRYEETWNKLTVGKKIESGGLESYLQWWNKVREVQVKNISLMSQSDDTALLKVDFWFSMENGRIAKENNKRIYLVWNNDSSTWLISEILFFNSLIGEGFPKSQCGDLSVTKPFYRVYISDRGSLDKLKKNFCKDSLRKGNRFQAAAFDDYQKAQDFKQFMNLHFNQVEIEEIW